MFDKSRRFTFSKERSRQDRKLRKEFMLCSLLREKKPGQIVVGCNRSQKINILTITH